MEEEDEKEELLQQYKSYCEYCGEEMIILPTFRYGRVTGKLRISKASFICPNKKFMFDQHSKYTIDENAD